MNKYVCLFVQFHQHAGESEVKNDVPGKSVQVSQLPAVTYLSALVTVDSTSRYGHDVVAMAIVMD